MAANFLNIKPLLVLCCKTCANMMKGKDYLELREEFGIEGDYTIEEEEQIKKDFAWCKES
eukprot:TRINITY_DN69611_c0_g2_i1.p1 TRINITY_DN69611_c0_g2~~TRINITY_DN69611_c0_g2_i1.p1  ORF type:complete len:60 (+),score=17.77 TRINITY_DN69611_c0_g2_i1:116-295(+)